MVDGACQLNIAGGVLGRDQVRPTEPVEEVAHLPHAHHLLALLFRLLQTALTTPVGLLGAPLTATAAIVVPTPTPGEWTAQWCGLGVAVVARGH